MKSLTFLLLSTLLLSGLAQDCNNPLLTTFNLTGLSQPQPGTGLPFCQDLQGGQTCCSNDTVNQFQTLINNLQQALLNTAGQRDTNFVTLRNDVLNNYDTAVTNLSNFDNDISNLQSNESVVGNEIRRELNIFQNVSNLNDNIDDNDEFNNTLTDYQKKRVTCFNTLLQTQASLWCLACNPNYATLGVSSNGSIAFSSELNNTIASACLPFTESGNNFNGLFQANQTSDRVQSLNNYLQSYRDAGNVPPNTTISGDVIQLEDPTQRTNSIPDGCSGSTCTWQNENLFNNGVLNQSVVANGAGIIGGTDIVLPDIGPQNLTSQANSSNATSNNTAIATPNATNTTTNATTPSANNATNGTTGAANTTIVNNTTNVTGDSTRLLQNVDTFNPNLDQSGVQLAVIADPAQVSGLQGNGSSVSPNNDNTDTDDNTLSSRKIVASGLTIIILIVGALIV